mmetsp:Transcript_22673/g.41732  ORF Transcript_22673/g.41732 Transcript_22673/m.41732 type:complete len:105 (-) Transcript_22673:194-508(-)
MNKATVEFQVALVRSTPEEKYGMKYKISKDSGSTKIIVTEIRAGCLLEKHNQEIKDLIGQEESELSTHEVQIDDEVLEVNGATEPDKIKDILANDNIVHILFRR